MPAEAALDGRIGCAILQVTLKGLGEKLIFLQICNLYAIQIHTTSCSLWLQFARVLIRLWAPEQGGGLLQVPIRTEMVLSLYIIFLISLLLLRESFFLLSLIQKKLLCALILHIVVGMY